MEKALRLGLEPSNPATSCSEILHSNPTAPSEYYWLRSANGSAVRVYCDMTLTCKGVGGGWLQLVKLDMTNTSIQCPPGTRLRTDLPRRLCGQTSNTAGCSSTTFDVYGVEYSEVCGKIIAYQDASPDSFEELTLARTFSIDGNYVDGVSLTHGSNPRQHIWTFAAALDEVGTVQHPSCPCINTEQGNSSIARPPSFVGDDYFCDTASDTTFSFVFFPLDPLWDGAGCGPLNACCSLNNPPWFLKQLPASTTDDIEMRMCRDQDEDDEGTPIEIIEIYVR